MTTMTPTTPTTHRILTVHADVDLPMRCAILDAVEQALKSQGVQRVWIDPDHPSELVVLAELDAL
ncbi:hypothetical protein [Nocardioides sp. SR21]|uniref:hypothetical protein n=1 Tax=Nocardioides sp. SR21 TaxID=2919501 RepID=UPI001FAA03C8|nr:hypothetical protein [Nocardioides sp. SR21]